MAKCKGLLIYMSIVRYVDENYQNMYLTRAIGPTAPLLLLNLHMKARYL